MRKFLVILLFSTILLGATYYLYASHSQEEDSLVIALRDSSFFPIKPPSKLHTVGAIYYIEPDLGRVTRLCSPHSEISENVVHKSPSAVVEGTYVSKIKYGSQISAKTGQMVGGRGSVDDQRAIKLDFKLTNVFIYEIDVDSGKSVLENLMNRKDCSDTVTEYWHLGGYICQDTQLLVATALFDRGWESDTVASLDLNTKNALASEIEAATGAHLTGSEGRSTSGEGLQWGMQIPPLCITPPWARFPRTFPRNYFDRVLNFIKFNIVERILPAPQGT